VFYDEDGKLWMSYGSWSGGIWMLELDEYTGLRDYDVNYELTGSGDGITVDPYFGKKIAGGYYVSGEASYIEYIGGYYFLFMSYGGLAAGGNKNDYNNGGYQMRVFRSEKPDGPYVDIRNTNAVFESYKLNFGAQAYDNRGVNIFGAYTNWGNQAKGNTGERSQGHNSIIAAEDGRTYLVYHTRFQNRGEEHQVRVHQVFQNKDGWLVAAPFEYTGEAVKSADIAASQQISTAQVPGTYQLLVHKYKLDHTTKEAVKPVEIELHADGTITGAEKGTWTVTEGTSYVSIKLNSFSEAFEGVVVEQTLEPKDDKAVAFTGVNQTGVTIWGYQTAAATGIRSIEASAVKGDDAIYDLQGRRVTTPQRKGVYIRNGKKFVMN
jgi:arabinan endo-1,5-alpha-L-arabinosidase